MGPNSLDPNPKIFISYASGKVAPQLAKRLWEVLKSDFDCDPFYFEDENGGGVEIISNLDAHLNNAEIFLAIVNSNYLSSGWCFLEYLYWQERQQALRQFGPRSETLLDIRKIYLEEKQEDLDSDKFKAEAAEAAERRFRKLLKDHSFLYQKFPLLSKNKLCDAINSWHSAIISQLALYMDLSSANPIAPELSLEKSGSSLYAKLKKDFGYDGSPNGSARFVKTIADLRELRAKDPWGHENTKEAIRSATSLAAFCIGIDGYRHGGWGFSFGNLFDYDEDGDFLAHGRLDTNSFVLDSLSSFLEPRVLEEEQHDAYYGEAEDPTIAHSIAYDRKPSTVRIIGTLSHNEGLSHSRYSRAFRDIRSMRKFLAEEQKKNAVNFGNYAANRWWSIEPGKAAVTDEVLLFELYSRLKNFETAAESITTYTNHIPPPESDRPRRQLSALAMEEISSLAVLSKEASEALSIRVADSLNSASRLLDVYHDDALLPFRAIKKLLDSAEQFAHEFRNLNSNEFRDWYRECTLKALKLYFLTRFEEGRSLLRKWYGKRTSNSVDRGAFKQDLKTIGQFLNACQVAGDDVHIQEMRSRIVGVCSLLILTLLLIRRNGKTDEPQIEKEFRDLMDAWRKVITARDCHRLIMSMDSIGWAALLRVTDEIGIVQSVKEIRSDQLAVQLRASWAKAKAIAADRLTHLLHDETHDPASMRQELRTMLEDRFLAWSNEYLTFPADRGTIMEQLQSASFLGGGFNSPPDSFGGDVNSGNSSTTLVGNLYVRMDGHRHYQIYAADQGYNALFVAPMNKLLDMRIYDLSRLRGLLGHADHDLIKFVGRNVVQKCFELKRKTGGSLEWDVVNFEEATETVARELANEGDKGVGIIHLLQIGAGGAERKWVMRAATSRKVPSRLGTPMLHAGPGGTVTELQWRFIDVPEVVFDRKLFT